MGPILCIGIGNPYRRDDGVGLVVADRLAALALPGVRVRRASGEGAALIECLAGAARAVLVDAVSSGAAPGTVHRIEADAGPVPARLLSCSTHAFGVAEAIELARVLGQLPSRLTVLGVEGGDFGSGAGLSEPVARAVDAVVEAVVGLLGTGGATCTRRG